MSVTHVLCSHERGAFGWAERTGGALSACEQLSLAPAIARGYLSVLRALVPLATGAKRVPPMAEIPDSRLVALAVEAARDVPASIVGHGYRTWAFGGVLAQQDGRGLDPELFFVASLLHDAGLTSSVLGQDFTLRSAALALAACQRADTPQARRTTIADAIVAHLTPGLDPAVDTLAYYVQAGALLDLTGARMRELPRSYLRSVYARHERTGLSALILKSVRDERRAVPRGRMALLDRGGLSLAIRLCPTRSY